VPFGWRRKQTRSAPIRPYRRVQPPPSEPIEVQILSETSIDILHARDISIGGVGVYVPHGFRGCKIEDELDLVITLPRTRTFSAKGVIRHVTGVPDLSGYFGVEFTYVAPEHRALIQEYVNRRAKF
jgi:c-di-GMP-binding flagellar brake protein YcgR